MQSLDSLDAHLKMRTTKYNNVFGQGQENFTPNVGDPTPSFKDGFYATFSKHGCIAAPEVIISKPENDRREEYRPEIEVNQFEEDSEEDSDLARSNSEISLCNELKTKGSTNPSVCNFSEVSTPMTFERYNHSDNEASRKTGMKKLKMFSKGSIKYIKDHKGSNINTKNVYSEPDSSTNQYKDARFNIKAREIQSPTEINPHMRADQKTREGDELFDGNKRIIILHHNESGHSQNIREKIRQIKAKYNFDN